MKGYFEMIERQSLDALSNLVQSEAPLKAEDVNFLSYMWKEEEGSGPSQQSALGISTDGHASQQGIGTLNAKTHTPAVFR